MNAKPVLGYIGRSIAGRSKEKIFGAHEAACVALYWVVPVLPLLLVQKKCSQVGMSPVVSH